MDTAEFFRALYGNCHDGVVVLCTLPEKQLRQHDLRRSDALETLTEDAKRLGKSTNLYLSLNPRINGLSTDIRGGEDEISALVIIGADYDVLGPAHTEKELPPSKEAVLEHLKMLPLRPTIIVDSGHGIYAFWLLKTPFIIRSDSDRAKAKGTVTGYGKFLMQKSRENGWKLDNVFDLARMLRVPGSTNFKLDEPVPSCILSAEDNYYTLEDFAEYYDAPIAPETTPFEADERIVGSAERIMERCLFMQKMTDDPDAVTEPEWKAQCSNAVLTLDGADLFHDWSSHYSGYSFKETEYKIARALEAKKPCTCKYISETLGFQCPESGCGVKAPIVLAQYTKLEQLQNLLAKDKLADEEALDDYVLNLACWAKENAPADYSRLKLKVKRTAVGLRDFERAVRCEMDKHAQLEFDDVPKKIVMDGIDLHGAMEPGSYQVSIESGVTSTGCINGMPITVCLCPEPVMITHRLENIDSGQEKMEVSFFRNNRWKTLVAARSVFLNKNSLVKLSDGGLPVTSDNSEGVVRYLAAYEAANAKVIPFTRSINRIGWIGKEFYPVSVDSPITYEGDDTDNLVGALVEHGDYDLWLNTARKLRENYISRAMMAVSYASPLLEPLQHRVFDTHFWHSTRSGKTATLKYALSIWGNPMKLMGNFNSTAVGLERRAGTLKHLPLGLDELQVLNEKRLSASLIIYSLGNGYGKTRGAKNGGLQDVPTWRNCIISTGEQPLGNDTTMDGISSRVLELYGAPIEDAEFGRNVHQISESNYGFAGKRYIDYIVNTIMTSKDKIRQDYENIREKLQAGFDGDPGVHLDNIAVLALADCYSSVCLFGMTEEDAVAEAVSLGNKVLKNTKSLEKEDVVERAWHFTQSWVASNKTRFESAISPCYGKIEQNRVYVIASVLRQTLEENGFSYPKSVKGFKERGYIDTFANAEGADNIQCQKKIQGVNVRTIAMRLDVEADAEDFLT